MAFLVFFNIYSRCHRLSWHCIPLSLKVVDIESSSPFSAICEVFGLHYILNLFGVSKVIAASASAASEAKVDLSEKSGVTAEVEKIRVFVEKNGTVVREVFNDMSVEEEAIIDLPVLKEGKKSKKADKN